jgi:hypothetical protein
MNQKAGRPVVMRVRALLFCLLIGAFGCRQVPTTQREESPPAGVDGVMDMAEEGRDQVPIEKELAPPKGFFGRRGSLNGGWSSESNEIERSLGVK